MVSIVFWSSIMLIAAYFLENTMFQGILFAYLCMLPYFIAIVLNNKYHGLDILRIDFTEIADGARIAE